MNKDLKDYVYLDGVYFKEEQILKMATNAGSFSVAEHYLCAYLAHAIMYGKKDCLEHLNEVREMYQASPIPIYNNIAQSDKCGRDRINDTDIKVRKLFSRLNGNDKIKMLKISLAQLRSECSLFSQKNHWLGVMMVIRDRLDNNINQRNFFPYAQMITPDNWPESIRIGKHTAKNFSRLLCDGDRCEPYYDMDKNPQEELCDMFWDIVKRIILTEFP